MDRSAYSPIFELARNGTVESIHYGSLAVVDPEGNLVASWGDPYTVAFLRSSAKPFQILPYLEQGGKGHDDLSLQEIALMCASHSGSDEHITVLCQLQSRVGVRETDLLCGVHPLTNKLTLNAMHQRGEALSSNRNNCSGKHTGMLAFARMRGLPLETYLSESHPIQQDILRTFAEMSSLPVENIAIGTDGCSAPNFAVPLYNAALAFARLMDPQAGGVQSVSRAEACSVVLNAMTSYPEMVSGPGGFDTELMKLEQGRVLVKGGAEGYMGMGLRQDVLKPGSPALGIVIKIADGDLGSHSRPAGDQLGHIRPAVALEVIRQLGALSAKSQEALTDFGPMLRLQNWRQIDIGLGRPCFTLFYTG